ncbi:DUF2157 domain-containing protein [Streptomyces sp. CB03911]|uniref:DUF2157 domain-containing protein n=1 Tax=Streptomyces sp. CB03911 TaxID=1804758 RepID=UPI00093A1F11|nr:DUF2157 domain-containing protein [Streptomyces sp. CB03911]OKI14195.1 hypothetical protein A6A07_13670 [Streptomyces sp. CB03911]
MSLAITAAAQTTVPVTWTTSAGTTATVDMPTGLHAAYASDTHTATVVQLADAPQVSPAVSPGGVIGLSGATLVGLGIVVWVAAKWKQSPKEVKRAFVMGVVATILIGSWGLFGTLSNTVKTTGDSTGAVIGTVGQGGAGTGTTPAR